MAGKDIQEATKKMAERKKLLRTPVPMLPDAPDNIKLSKAEFIARRRKSKQEDIEKEKVWQEHLAKKLTHPAIAEDSNGVQSEQGETKEESKKVLRGRPKKVE